MGAWGTGIKQDDTVLDVLGIFDDSLKAGGDIDAATTCVLAAFARVLDDPDEGPLVWLGIAHAQWGYGGLSSDVLERVRSDVESGAGLERWREAGERELAKRRAALQSFLSKIQEPNPRPKRFPRVVARPPKFAAGDCLSLELTNGRYGAAIVLRADHSNPEYGLNLIAVLDYVEPIPPDSAVFESRRWLRLAEGHRPGRVDAAWYYPLQFRSEKDHIKVVGNTRLLSSDPCESDRYVGWRYLRKSAVSDRNRSIAT